MGNVTLSETEGGAVHNEERSAGRPNPWGGWVEIEGLITIAHRVEEDVMGSFVESSHHLTEGLVGDLGGEHNLVVAI